MPRKHPPNGRKFFTEILVRVAYDAPDAPRARLLASEMSAQLSEVTLMGDIHSTKVTSVKAIRRNIAEEQELLNVDQ